MAIDDAFASTMERVALTMRGTVYGRGTDGKYTVPVKTGLKCYLAPLNQGISAVQTGAARSELAARGLLDWERSYTMPTAAQMVVDAHGDQRWNVQKSTEWRDLGPGNGTIAFHADVVRAV